MKHSAFTRVLKTPPPTEAYRRGYDNIDWSDNSASLKTHKIQSLGGVQSSESIMRTARDWAQHNHKALVCVTAQRDDLGRYFALVKYRD